MSIFFFNTLVLHPLRVADSFYASWKKEKGILHNCTLLHIGIALLIFLLGNEHLQAQPWGFYNFPLAPQASTNAGKTGIGGFTLGIAAQNPQTLLHLYANQLVPSGLPTSILRLQTNLNNLTDNNPTFGENKIQFWSGMLGGTGQLTDWQVSSIQSIGSILPGDNRIGGLQFNAYSTTPDAFFNPIPKENLAYKYEIIQRMPAWNQDYIRHSFTTGGWNCGNLVVIERGEDMSGPALKLYRGDGTAPELCPNTIAEAWWIDNSAVTRGYTPGLAGGLYNTEFYNPGLDFKFAQGPIGSEIPKTMMSIVASGSVGIGTRAPVSRLHVTGGAILFEGTQGNTPLAPSTAELGAGTRLMWIPAKAAFRAGIVSSSEWDDANIGTGSVAMGESCTASGPRDISIGWSNRAQSNTTSNHCSMAIGHSNGSTGMDAAAIGYNNTATGYASLALGDGCTASGTDAVAIGTTNTASNTRSFAIGTGVTNSLSNSLAVGFGGTTLLVNSSSVGINTTSPQCTLGVNGTACIGWGGNDPVPTATATSPTVGMMIEHATIIGGSGGAAAFIDRDPNAPVDHSSMLHVWGHAVKSDNLSNWDIPSDARYKKDVRPFTDGLEQLRQINPVRFRYNEELGVPESDRDGIGVIAQDIQKVLPYTVFESALTRTIKTKEEKRYEVDAVDTVYHPMHSKDSHDENLNSKGDAVYIPTKKWVTEPAEYHTESKPLLTYNSSALTYVIVNAIKEMDIVHAAYKEATDNKIISLQATNDSLRVVTRNLEERIARLETKNTMPLTEAMDVILEQNNPNPFSDMASITYYIPENVAGVTEMVISSTDQKNILKQFPLEKGTPTQVQVNAKEFNTGVYVYSIVNNGRILAAKKMIIMH